MASGWFLPPGAPLDDFLIESLMRGIAGDPLESTHMCFLLCGDTEDWSLTYTG